jgi:hypothetical protein
MGKSRRKKNILNYFFFKKKSLKPNALYRNFRILNFQNGTQVQIGSLIAGNLNITSAPIYHDGTTTVSISVDLSFI